MKIWIEARPPLSAYNDGTAYYISSGKAPKWNARLGQWTTGRFICADWLETLLPDLQLPEVGELAELEVNHLETWEMR